MEYSAFVLQSGFEWFGLFSNLNAFLVFMIFLMGAFAAMIAQKLTLAGFASFISFIYITQETDLFIFDGMLYAVITIILLFLSVRSYRIFYGDSGGEPTV